MYDRLAAMGCLNSRCGAGFYASAAPAFAEAHIAPLDTHKRNEQPVPADPGRVLEAWATTRCSPAARGCRIPLDEGGIRQSLNVLAPQEWHPSARIRTSIRVSAVARAPRADAGLAGHHRACRPAPADAGDQPGA